MIDRKALLSDLQTQVKAVETDLEGQVKREEAVRNRLRAEYDASKKVGRTAATWQSWLDERITQVAVAWVLGTVFVRFVEDNGLVPEPYITAPDVTGREVALARYDEYVDKAEDPTYRGWFEHAFAELAEGPAGKLLFSDHNPLWQIPLSHEGAGALRDFWQRTRDDEAGASILVHDFTDPLSEDGDDYGTKGWDTRFLGDLYQDLSEAARKNYALLQTPEFVEEFILDRTMNPVLRERGGVEGLKMIDPTCGSGHFVLGAFRRLVREWAARRPELDAHARVREALESVHGVDINPFAVAIARFRLLIAAMAAAGMRTLEEAAAYEWPMQLAVGDSLIKPRQVTDQLFTAAVDPLAEFKYATEDIHERPYILDEGRYDVVVGNPPYITVKDKKLNKHYRELYDACSGKYALSVPFAQRFFELSKKDGGDGKGYGMVGQITSNSFMKREFGTKLIESFFRDEVELTEVIDTSGAYIPGHGTPTVILIGRNRDWTQGRGDTIRTVRSVQGEPSAPEDPERGLVWSAIVGQIDQPGSVSQWVSVGDLDRKTYFGTQPWVLAAGGREMLSRLADSPEGSLSALASEAGIMSVTGEDDLYLLPADGTASRIGVPQTQPLVTGDAIRDHEIRYTYDTVWPYGEQLKVLPLADIPEVGKYLTPYRAAIARRRRFGTPMVARGLAWYEWQELYAAKLRSPLAIAFAFVATHNHFVLDRGGKVFNRSAPVIKLREGATEAEHLQLLGVLNSSTAGFWLKMVSHNKGSTVDVRGARQSTIPFEDFYEFTGTKLREFPLPSAYPTTLATALDTAAQQLAATTPTAVAAQAVPTAQSLREARATYESTRARMIAFQEELDWQVYSLYGLTDTDLRPADPADVPPLALGERAFEIVLARAIERGEASSEWFTRHNSTPITELPAHWPAAYKDIVNQRIATMESNSAIGMVERPEYKRRWATDGWDAMQKQALRAWLLDRIEARRELWFDGNDQPTLITLARLTDRLQEDDDFAAVLNLYAPRADFAKTVAELVSDQHVPAAAALRYKPAGLKKRADWERTWEQQRAEDAATSEDEKRKIREATAVPPKYASADFLRTSFWAQRGKLDVPKERFISYGAQNVQVPTLLGWAGWDHLQQAQAVVGYLNDNQLTRDELIPYLAALLELQPWLDQWHGEYLPDFGQSAAQAYHDFRLALQGEHGLTDEDIRAWRPAAAARGGGAKKAK